MTGRKHMESDAQRCLSAPATVIPLLRRERAAPDPSRMIAALRQIGYGFEQAIADLIDNSISASATSILVRFLCDQDRIVSVIVADNGLGMSEALLHNAMRFGASNNPTPASLGKYGMGMKLASLSFARTLTVISRAQAHASGRRWTVRGIENGWACEVISSTDAAGLLDAPWGSVDTSTSGTLVIWDDIDKLPSAAGGMKQTVRLLASRLQTHLGLCFHRFIESQHLQINLDQQLLGTMERSVRVSIPGLNPFAYPQSGHREYPSRFTAHIPELGPLEMDAHVWPPNSDLPQYKLGNKAASRQGFYFYRNDRLIQAGGWNGVVQSDSEPHGSLARVAIDLPESFDSAFGLNVQKSNVVVPPSFETAARSSRSDDGTAFETYRGAAVSVYRRGDRRAERAKPVIPDGGLPRSLAEVARRLIAPDEPEPRRIRFRWRRLPPSEFFQLERSSRTIVLNSIHREAILGSDSTASSAVPLLKMALFLLFESDIDSERVSRNQSRRIELANSLLACAAQSRELQN